jgi:hypothetical protein
MSRCAALRECASHHRGPPPEARRTRDWWPIFLRKFCCSGIFCGFNRLTCRSTAFDPFSWPCQFPCAVFLLQVRRDVRPSGIGQSVFFLRRQHAALGRYQISRARIAPRRRCIDRRHFLRGRCGVCARGHGEAHRVGDLHSSLRQRGFSQKFFAFGILYKINRLALPSTAFGACQIAYERHLCQVRRDVRVSWDRAGALPATERGLRATADSLCADRAGASLPMRATSLSAAGLSSVPRRSSGAAARSDSPS